MSGNSEVSRENVQILKYFAQKDLQMNSFRTMDSWLEFEMYFIKTLSTIVCFPGEPRDTMVKTKQKNLRLSHFSLCHFNREGKLRKWSASFMFFDLKKNGLSKV